MGCLCDLIFVRELRTDDWQESFFFWTVALGAPYMRASFVELS